MYERKVKKKKSVIGIFHLLSLATGKQEREKAMGIERSFQIRSIERDGVIWTATREQRKWAPVGRWGTRNGEGGGSEHQSTREKARRASSANRPSRSCQRFLSPWHGTQMNTEVSLCEFSVLSVMVGLGIDHVLHTAFQPGIKMEGGGGVAECCNVIILSHFSEN